MAPERAEGQNIALNLTRTRITVLMFDMTLIVFLLSVEASRATPGGHPLAERLTISIALFSGFWLTMLSLFWLLASQRWDALGASRPAAFAFGVITSYLGIAQTITAFMHQYLGNGALLILLVMGGSIWVTLNYAGPVSVCLKTTLRGGRRWALAAYCIALMVPVHWLYAKAWHVEYLATDPSASLLRLFLLQLAQPLLWFS